MRKQKGKNCDKAQFQFWTSVYFYSAPSTTLNVCITIFIKNISDWAMEMHCAKYHTFSHKLTLMHLSMGQFQVITTYCSFVHVLKKPYSQARQEKCNFSFTILSSTSLLRLQNSFLLQIKTKPQTLNKMLPVHYW